MKDTRNTSSESSSEKWGMETFSDFTTLLVRSLLWHLASLASLSPGPADCGEHGGLVPNLAQAGTCGGADERRRGMCVAFRPRQHASSPRLAARRDTSRAHAVFVALCQQDAHHEPQTCAVRGPVERERGPRPLPFSDALGPRHVGMRIEFSRGAALSLRCRWPCRSRSWQDSLVTRKLQKSCAPRFPESYPRRAPELSAGFGRSLAEL